MKYSNKALESLTAVERRRLLARILEKRAVDSGVASYLSSMQQSLWFLHQLDPQSAAYNTVLSVQIESSIDTDVLARALNALVAQTPALRTYFSAIGDEPLQFVQQATDFKLDLEQAHHWSLEKLRIAILQFTQLPFDLEKGPIFRAKLYTIAPKNYVLVLVVHHIAGDFWSLQILLKELGRLYSALRRRTQILDDTSKATYFDFVAWQRTFLESKEGERQKRYWGGELCSEVPIYKFYSSATNDAAKFRSHAVEIGVEQTECLRSSAKDCGVTLFTLTLTAMQILLHKYTDESTLLIGIPVAGRSDRKFHDTVGCFVNVLPIQSEMIGVESFKEILSNSNDVLLRALENADYPFGLISQNFASQRGNKLTQLVQLTFQLERLHQFAKSEIELFNFKENAEESSARIESGPDLRLGLQLGDLSLRHFYLEQQLGQYDLTIRLFDNGHKIVCIFDYRCSAIGRTTIERLAGHYLQLLESVVSNPEERIGQLSFLTPTEKRQLLVEWNDTFVDYPGDLCIHDMIEQQVERSPEAIALVFEEQRLTYAELNARSNQLAHWLRSQGVGPEVLVAVCLDRSIEMVVSLLGILKAGGAYVPLDPEYPKDRLNYMLQDSKAKVLVSTTVHASQWPEFDGKVFAWDLLREELNQQPETNPSKIASPSNLAYVIYTSGSTGKPKGCMNSHAGMLNRLLWMIGALDLQASDCYIQKTPFGFDVSVWEFFCPLLSGGRLVVINPGGHMDARYIASVVQEESVSIMHFVPSMLHTFLLEDSSLAQRSLRHIVCSGEALPLKVKDDCLSAIDVALHNLYGPTEASIDVTFHNCSRKQGLTTVPIGRPISNTQVYVLDGEMEVCPVGVPGELYIGGAGLARGYLNRADLTAEKFVPNPFSDRPGARLYKTGDQCRWLEDGQLEFIGRLDHQVKIRGFRIELGEIESALEQHPSIAQVVVTAREVRSGETSLVAYVLSSTESHVEPEVLRGYLKSHLPEYMIPNWFVELEEFPLTPNGKVDRLALPVPDGSRPEWMQGFVAPRTPTEVALAAIWSEVLGVEQVGIHDNFFELGGHSLLATQVVSRVRRAFSEDVPLRQMFEEPTIAGFARLVDSIGEVRRPSLPALVPQDRPEVLPLSFAQQRLWVLDQLSPGNAFYNMPGAVRIEGRFDREAFEQSLKEIVARHEALRTIFAVVDGQPSQFIVPKLTLEIPITDLTELGDIERDTEVQQLLYEEAQKPFDLSVGPLVRFRLIRLHEELHVVSITMHHILSDGWSLGVFLREFTTLYHAFVKQQPNPLPELSVQYADYALWQRQWLVGETLESQLAYWKKQLSDVPQLDLPTDHARPAMPSLRGSTYHFVVSPELYRGLERLSRQESTTLFMTLLSAWQVLLSRYSGQTDFCIGTPVAGRTHAEIENLIGFFVNTLVLRINLSKNPRFTEVLSQVRKSTLEALSHQDLPFEQLVDQVETRRDLSRNPLFQVMFAMQNTTLGAMEVGDLKFVPLPTESGTAKFDLTLALSEQAGGFAGTLEYSTDIFERTTIERLAGHYLQLLESVVSNPEERIGQLSFLTPTEKRQLLVEWNDTFVDYPGDLCIHDMIEQQVERSPEAIALVFEEQRLTYAELNARSNQLAHWLRSQGVGPEVLVAVCLDRSIEMVVSLLGILKAGGAYVPLDPEYPKDRLNYMLQDSRAKVLVSMTEHASQWPEFDGKVFAWDLLREELNQQPETNPSKIASPGNLAYVIYTSGSTGKPKGVAIEHRGLANLRNSMQLIIGYRSTDVIVAVTTFGFDIAFIELISPLSEGIQIVIASRSAAQEPFKLSRLLERCKATVLQGTPAVLQSIIDTGWLATNGVKLLCGGEALASGLARRLLKQGTVWNLYGPTESTVWSTSNLLLSLSEQVPIGRPISNTQVYVLDGEMEVCPVGVPGELYIGGAGLARGYLNRADLTAEKFVPNPFSDRPGARLYKTGDQCRWLEDGQLEFIGRLDHQVKIRGFRIELGEIESALEQHPSIAQVVVTAREVRSGETSLVAYVLSSTESHVEPEVLRGYLKSHLPEYMIPNWFVELEEFPLTPNGKVDRLALPVPDGSRPEWMQGFVAPRTPTEVALAAIWSEVLGVEQVGIHDNFFELGGHSLLATQVVSRVRRAFSEDVPLRQMFEEPTIAGFARLVDSIGEVRRPSLPALVPQDRPEVLPLSFAQQRLWVLDQLSPGNAFYNMPGAVRIEGRFDREAFEQSLKEIVARHEALRTIFAVVDGQPSQFIVPKLTLEIPITDLTELGDIERDTEVQQLLYEEAQKPFDLSVGPLVRFRLIRLHEELHVVSITMHHILSDGWSLGVFLREFTTLYHAFVKQQPNPLPELSVQYADYALWQRQWLVGETLESQLAYWKKQLSDVPQLDLPTDHARPSIPSLQGSTYHFVVSPELYRGLERLSRQESTTLFMTLLSAWQVLLSRYSGQTDFCIGTPVAGRTHAEIENLIGFFVNTLVLRVNLSNDPRFTEVLSEVRKSTLEALSHQDLPFEQLVSQIETRRDLRRNPLFQVVFAMQNTTLGAMEVGDLKFVPLPTESGTAKFDLTLALSEQAGGFSGTLEYSTDIFERTTIERLAGHYLQLLESVVSNPEERIGQLSFLTPTEKRQLLVEWNDTFVDYPGDLCIHDMIEQQVERSPEAIALVFEEQRLTYAELNARSNQLAHWLRSQGVGPEVLVAVCLDRSIEMVVSLLGILKAGGAYVPLDPEYPKDRLNYMLQDSRAKVLVSMTEHASQWPEFDGKVFAWDLLREELNRQPETNPRRIASPGNLAYVIYTSGSTGKPKGVAIEHRSLMRLFETTKGLFNFHCNDVWSGFHSYSFDFSVWEIWGAFYHGATLVLVSSLERSSIFEFVDLLIRHNVTILNQTPSAFGELDRHFSGEIANRSVPSLRYLVFGGEKLETHMLQSWFARQKHKNVQVVNMYGITEVTVHATFCSITTTNTDSSLSPIGRALSDLAIYVLDNLMQLCPIGVPGELYIAGLGLARGYLNRPDLTAEKFVPNPFSETPGSRLYKTGDQCRWLEDGQLEFIGRLDHQVKIRGYRIELGEIESFLLKQPGIQQAVVVVKEDQQRGKNLVAYLVFAQNDASEQVAEWKHLYDDVYEAASKSSLTEDFIGWNSSYTGQPIPLAQMRIWKNDRICKLLAGEPNRVLEIGCGTGLLLFAIGPHVERYDGCDFSQRVIERTQEAVLESDLVHVEVFHRSAEDLSGFSDGFYDLVILNSVVQYFPNSSYFEVVFSQALAKVRPGGRLFIGDVRNLNLLGEFHLDVQLSKAANIDSMNRLRQRIESKIRAEKELLIAPEYFRKLATRDKDLLVSISMQRGSDTNELNAFRYDVVIHKATSHATDVVPAVKLWKSFEAVDSLQTLLQNERPRALGVVGIPNARLLRRVCSVEELCSSQYRSAEELRNAISKSCDSNPINPEDVWNIHQDYEVHLQFSKSNKYSFDAILKLKEEKANYVLSDLGDNGTDQPIVAFNTPSQEQTYKRFILDLRANLQSKLLSHMIPTHFVRLERLPLTPSGKIDRSALPMPDSTRPEIDSEYVAPRTDAEKKLAEIWSHVLGIEQVGIHDNFFELGGHSLLATQVVSRVRRAFSDDVPLRQMFEEPTIAGFARLVDSLGEVRRPSLPALVPQDRPEVLPLSFAQQRLWFLDQLSPGNAFYNMPGAVRIEGRFDREAFEQSLKEIVARHEALRTIFAVVDGQPSQFIVPKLTLEIPITDLTELGDIERDTEVQQLLYEEAQKPFDLSVGPLVRFRLIRLHEELHVVSITMHHILSDGWSLGVFLREFTTLYHAFVKQQPNPLPELSVQYADYALWQRQWLVGETLESQLAYWKKQLSDVPQLDLPTDHARPSIPSLQGSTYHFVVSPELYRGLERLSRQESTTLFMTLLSAWQVLLSRYSGQTDFCIGTPVAGRTHAEIENLIGFFVNTLVLRVNLSNDPRFTEVLSEVRKSTLEALSHQDLPFEQLVSQIETRRDLRRNPLFQVMFAMQNTTLGAMEVGDLKFVPLSTESDTAKFDLTLALSEQAGGFSGVLQYSTDIFERTTIERLAGHYLQLLESVVSNPEERIGQLSFLTPTEKRQLLVEWNDTFVDYPGDLCIHDMIEQQVERSPDAIALVFEEQRLTYAELNARSNQLAHWLRSQGVGPEVLVAVCLDRSIEMVVSLLGILKAGGAYVPLDPEYPKDRLNYMLQDSRAKVLVSMTEHASQWPEFDGKVFAWDLLREELNRQPETNPRTIASPGNLAYVIYTSGSTGKPKGVAIEHRGVVSFLDWAKSTFESKEYQTVLCMTSVNFDLFVFEVFAVHASGGTTKLAKLPTNTNVDTTGITLINTVPSVIKSMIDSDAIHESVRTINLAGEKLSQELVRSIYHKTNIEKVFDLYGPTETTTYSTFCRRDLYASESIGRPISNTQVYVLDREMEVCPVGVPGELYIGGAGLARGYLNRADLTAEKFVPNPFSDRPGARLYKTGDQCRWLEDGQLEFIGRLDHQVKIRGFRIELGEIESALEQHPSIAQVVVTAREVRSGETSLVAYVLSSTESHVEPEVLRGYLKSHLPEYMIPNWFVELEEFPLTPNGKVDRLALPVPDGSRPEWMQGFVAPRTPTEVALAAIWSEVLGVEQVGIHDNFFELGGHSLLATQVVSRVRRAFSEDVPLRQMFEEPTIAGFARLVDSIGEVRRPSLPALVPQDRPEVLPLSFAQQRLWVLDQLSPGNAFYNMPGAVRIEGRFDREAFEQSLKEIVARHEALRTIFAVVDGQPSQFIVPKLTLEIPITDLTELGDIERDTEVQQLLYEEAQKPFDLSVGPLVRFRLIRLHEELHVVSITMHHILSDGWSLGVFLREFTTLYHAFVKQQPNPLPELSVQYADYALWQRQWLVGETLESQLAYWKKQLSDVPQLDLPTDHARPAMPSLRGSTYHFVVSPELYRGLERLSRQESTTLFMTLLSAWQVLLSRYSGQTDFCIGTPVAGRTHAEIENLIGFFVNTLVLRINLSKNPRFTEVLSQVRKSTLEALSHQDLPFEQLVDQVETRRDLSRNPLFQVVFAMQNTTLGAMEVGDLKFVPLPTESGTAKFDLTLALSEQAGGFSGTLEYSTDIFERTTIERLAGHYLQLLESVVSNPEERIGQLSFLTPTEKRQLLVEWNDTFVDYPGDLCIHDMIEQQVERSPEAIALVFEEQRLTYAELNARSNQLAHWLRSQGVGPEVLVAVCLDRSIEMVVSLLGILKAGGAYVPLDPEYPKDRLNYMLQDSRAKVLVSMTEHASQWPEFDGKVFAWDLLREELNQQPETNPSKIASPGNLAYVIYTSGSTGKPKGVAIEHRGLANHSLWMGKASDLKSDDCVLQTASCSFDPSAWEIFASLASGLRLVLPLPGGHRDLHYLADLVRRNAVTIIDLPPSSLSKFLSEFRSSCLEAVRTIVCGGEVLTSSLCQLARKLPKAVLYNFFGPTESTINATSFLSKHERLEVSVPIGRPISNTQVYVLDREMEICPIGVPGELYIGGVGLARGYLNRADLTAEKFVPNPFSETPGSRLYKTGDQCRWLEDGQLEFIGRLDHQVKIRGFRIELGEIESALEQHPSIAQVVVTAREVRSGETSLVAYVLSSTESHVEPEVLRGYLKSHLPEYMIPNWFVELEEFPLTPNGKVDRLALPVPDGSRPEWMEGFVAPRTPTEATLAAIWSEVLGVEQVGIHDNFFELGGHSLLAIRLVAVLSNSFGYKLPVRQVFEQQTVARQSAFLDGQAMLRASSAFIELRRGSEMPPLFLIYPTGNVYCYSKLARSFSQNRSVFVNCKDFVDSDSRSDAFTIEKIAEKCVVEILQIQPEGSYVIGGWSIGGVLAYEVARQLRTMGRYVKLLALIDSMPPGSYSNNNLISNSISKTITSRFRPQIGHSGMHSNDTEMDVSESVVSGYLSGHIYQDLSLSEAPTELVAGEVMSRQASFNRCLDAVSSYVPQPLDGPIRLFLTEQRYAAKDASSYDTNIAAEWQRICNGEVESTQVDGDHFSIMFGDTFVAKLAHQIECSIEGVERDKKEDSAKVPLSGTFSHDK